MKLRKIFAGVVAAAMATTMATSAFAANGDRLQPAQATLAFADGQWLFSQWGGSETPATTMEALEEVTITGNGEYKVAIDFSKGINAWDSALEDVLLDEETGEPVIYTSVENVTCMAVMVNFAADDEANNNLMIDITSIKFDGVESMLEGVTSYTNAEDGIYRSTILNPYIGNIPDDARGKDLSTASATLTDFAGTWSRCEVTFTISGYPEAGSEPEAPTDPEPEAPADPEPEAPANPGDSSKPNAGTGAEGLALVAGIAVLATGAIVVAKKRK